MNASPSYLATTGEVVVGSFIVIHSRKKFRSQTPDFFLWTDGKAEMGRVREEEKKKSKKKKLRREKMQAREKVRKSLNTVFSNDLWLRRNKK